MLYRALHIAFAFLFLIKKRWSNTGLNNLLKGNLRNFWGIQVTSFCLSSPLNRMMIVMMMNRDNKSASWNDKPDLEVCLKCIKKSKFPEEWLKLKHSPFFKEIQSREQKPDFWNSFTKQTQQFLCTSKCLLKGTRDKESQKQEQRNRCNNYHAPVMKEQLRTTQK